MSPVRIDRARSAERISRDVETLAGPRYTSSPTAICRYAYTQVYENTLDYLTAELERIGFAVERDPVGTLIARNRPHGAPAFGIGSHCDSNRNGGKWDGTLGVVTALEVCRLADENRLGLALQFVSFLEEEGSGFGVGLLGSRLVAGKLGEPDLHAIRAIDDGRSFWEHAEAAGYSPGQWRECPAVLDGLTGWIELHIEQGRVLQDTSHRLGIVGAIAGIAWQDFVVDGRGDHAGATPMDLRVDPTPAVAECILELERLAHEADDATVATTGEIDVEPGLINAIAERVRFSIDVRSASDESLRGVGQEIAAFAEAAADRRGLSLRRVERQLVPATPLDQQVIAALETAAEATGEAAIRMISGAGHDTMCIAGVVPSAMLFVPCKDGISHHPAEDADPGDAALGAEVMLNAIRLLEA